MKRCKSAYRSGLSILYDSGPILVGISLILLDSWMLVESGGFEWILVDSGLDSDVDSSVVSNGYSWVFVDSGRL